MYTYALWKLRTGCNFIDNCDQDDKISYPFYSCSVPVIIIQLGYAVWMVNTESQHLMEFQKQEGRPLITPRPGPLLDKAVGHGPVRTDNMYTNPQGTTPDSSMRMVCHASYPALLITILALNINHFSAEWLLRFYCIINIPHNMSASVVRFGTGSQDLEYVSSIERKNNSICRQWHPGAMASWGNAHDCWYNLLSCVQ